MDIKVLKKKPKITYGDYEYLDLSDNSLKGYFSGFIGLEVVTSDYEMRLDLISLKWYGSTEHMDVIMKANNIFNPFAVKEDDVLVIPSLNEDSKVYKNGAVVEKNRVREKFIDTSRMSDSDLAKLKKLVERTRDKKNKLKNPLPPNMLQKGANSRNYVDGIVRLTDHHSTK